MMNLKSILLAASIAGAAFLCSLTEAASAVDCSRGGCEGAFGWGQPVRTFWANRVEVRQHRVASRRSARAAYSNGSSGGSGNYSNGSSGGSGNYSNGSSGGYSSASYQSSGSHGGYSAPAPVIIEAEPAESDPEAEAKAAIIERVGKMFEEMLANEMATFRAEQAEKRELPSADDLTSLPAWEYQTGPVYLADLPEWKAVQPDLPAWQFPAVIASL